MAKHGANSKSNSKSSTANNVSDSNKSDQETNNPSSSLSKSVSLLPLRVPKISTPTSILIEALVENLCSIYSRDKAEVLYNIVCDRLHQMNLIDESYNMKEFEGVRLEYQRAFHLLLKSSVGSSSGQASSSSSVILRPIWPITEIINSHYFREFEEIEFIAGGGFGKVYKVKHRLDGTEYAVKKIPIRSQGIESVRNYLSEVKTFATINHSNVVQYKAAWLELDSSSTQQMDGSTASDSIICSNVDNFEEESNTFTKLQPDHYDEQPLFHNNEPHSFSDPVSNDYDRNDDSMQTISSDFEIDFAHNSVDSTTCTGTRVKRGRVKRVSISEGGKIVCKVNTNDMRTQHKAQLKWATLYIQMALCQSTLKTWLEDRNLALERHNAIVPLNGLEMRQQTYEILIQLLQGLEYIHSKGIVHHDIKPSNIFIQEENGRILFQLGDFGLACPLQSVRHSLAFGTKLYSAPEQLAGKCDPKSDMYSLGIVLYELVEQFNTDMERIKSIEQLRTGNVSEKIQDQYPKLAEIMQKLVTPMPQNRPDATYLLKSLKQYIMGETDQKIENLQLQLAEKDKEISRLKRLLKSAGVSTL